MAQLGEALLTEYALITWVLAAIFALARENKSRRVWLATVASLAMCIAAVFIHGENVQTPAAALALVLLVLP